MKLWDIPTRKVKHTFRGHQHGIHSVALTPNDEQIVSADGGTVITIDVARRKAIASFVVRGRIHIAPGGSHLAACTGTKAELWDIARETQMGSSDFSEGESWSCVGWSADGSTVAIGTRRGVVFVERVL